MLQVYHLTSLIGDLTTALDNPAHADISVEEVTRRIEDRTVLSYLQERFGDELPMETFDGEVHDELIEMLQGMLNGYPPPHRINGIQNRGLCLLIAYINKRLDQIREIGQHPISD